MTRAFIISEDNELSCRQQEKVARALYVQVARNLENPHDPVASRLRRTRLQAARMIRLCWWNAMPDVND